MSSRASTLVGSARATVSTSWARVTGMALWRRATLRGSTASVSSGMGRLPRSRKGRPSWSERAGDLDLVGQAEGDDDLPQPPATALVLALDAQGLVQLRLGEDPPATSTSPSRRRPPGVPPAAQPVPISAVLPSPGSVPVLVLSAAAGLALTCGGRRPDTGRHEAGIRPSALRRLVPGPAAGHLRPGRRLRRAGRVPRLCPAVGVGPLLAGHDPLWRRPLGTLWHPRVLDDAVRPGRADQPRPAGHPGHGGRVPLAGPAGQDGGHPRPAQRGAARPRPGGRLERGRVHRERAAVPPARGAAGHARGGPGGAAGP